MPSSIGPLPHEVPGFSQIQLTVTEGDLGLPRSGRDGLLAALRDVPFEWAFALTARIDAVVRHGMRHGRPREAQLRVAADVFAGHPERDELLLLMARENRALFYTGYMHLVQRLLVYEALDGSEERPGDLGRMQTAFLAVSDVASQIEERPEGFDPDFYLGIMTRSAVAGASEPPVNAITRAYAVYHELPARLGPGDVPNFMAREEWEPDPASSLTVHQRFMAGMAVMGAVGVESDELPDAARPTGVPPDYFDVLAASLPGGPSSARFAEAISTDRAGLRADFEAMPDAWREAADNSLPFQRHPLLAQAAGGFLLSSHPALTSWLTRGVHYACLTPLEGSRQAKRFLSYVGRLFELYAVELMQDAHAGQPGVQVLGEAPYTDREGTKATSDIAVVDGEELVLLEVEARRFSARALLSDDPRDVGGELRTMVVEKAQQIDRCIDALRREQAPARLPGVDMATITRIRPVVVIEAAIGDHVMLREHLERELAGAFEQAGVRPLTVLSMSDLELLAGHIEHGHRLTVTLARWKDGGFRDTDLRRFCEAKEDLRRPRRPQSISRRWERLTAEVNDQFDDAARARLTEDG